MNIIINFKIQKFALILLTLLVSSVSFQNCVQVAGGVDASANVNGGTGNGTTYSVGGTITGLSTSGLILDLGVDGVLVESLTMIPTATSFTFTAAVPDQSTVSVTIGSQPAGQTCSVTNGGGIISGADKTNVQITCSAYVTLSGTVTGLPLNATLTVTESVTNQTFPVTGSGTSADTYSFSMPNGSYNLSVTQPTSPAMTCTHTTGSTAVIGTISGANVTNVNFDCIDVTAPAEVAGFTISAAAVGRQLNLTWVLPATVDFNRVRILRKTGTFTNVPNGDALATNIYEGSLSSFNDTGLIVVSGTAAPLVDGTTYTYTIYTIDNAGNISTGITATGTPADATAPSNATNFIITINPAGNRLDLSWTNSVSADFNHVVIKRGTGASIPTGPTDATAPTVTCAGLGGISGMIENCSDTTLLIDGTNYNYVIYSYDNANNVSTTGTANSAAPADTTPPATPTAVSAVAAPSALSVTLSWTNPTDADFAGIIVMRSTLGYPTTTTVDANNIQAFASLTAPYATTFTDTNNINNGVIYYYSVFAKDEVPNWSTVFTTAPLAGVVSATATMVCVFDSTSVFDSCNFN